jgi:hypothetical protein
MSKKALVEVDSRIARIQREVADGRGSQIAQVEMCELLDERTKLLNTIAPRVDAHAARPAEKLVSGRLQGKP